jgi:transcriptional regulator GlxA family with amidase domain
VRGSTLRRLLSTAGVPINKIARRCAIRSGAQLEKVFKQRLGIFPSDYRDRTRPL